MTLEVDLWSGDGRPVRASQFGKQTGWSSKYSLKWVATATAGLIAAVALLAVGILNSGQPTRAALAAELYRSGAAAELSAFYRARGDQPLWAETSGLWPFWTQASLRPEAAQLAAIIADALPGEISGTTSKQLFLALGAARSGRPQDVVKAELALSIALGEYGRAAPDGPGGGALAFVDPAFGVTSSVRDVLQKTVEAPSVARHLAELRQRNPIYGALRKDLAAYRRTWSSLPQIEIPLGPPLKLGDAGDRVRLLHQRLGERPGDGMEGVFDRRLREAVSRFQVAHGLQATGQADKPTLVALNNGAAHYERLVVANLGRARLLPPPAAGRFILVNPAAGQLWVYEGNQPKQSMRVVVGTREAETPMMAGQIRYVVFNPYWEIPADLTRSSIAPKVLREGLGAFRARHLQALSDWGDDAAPIDPADVDWAAVAAGRQDLRLRQQPGGDNMMGEVKFMAPNELGIYLHDTPNKAAFRGAQRLLSAGCVRVENADDLVAWLFGHRMTDAASLGVDNRIDLETPVPVYITYLTAAPGAAGVTFYPDVYGRDPAALAALDRAAPQTRPAHGRGV